MKRYTLFFLLITFPALANDSKPYLICYTKLTDKHEIKQKAPDILKTTLESFSEEEIQNHIIKASEQESIIENNMDFSNPYKKIIIWTDGSKELTQALNDLKNFKEKGTFSVNTSDYQQQYWNKLDLFVITDPFDASAKDIFQKWFKRIKYALCKNFEDKYIKPYVQALFGNNDDAFSNVGKQHLPIVIENRGENNDDIISLQKWLNGKSIDSKSYFSSQLSQENQKYDNYYFDEGNNTNSKPSPTHLKLFKTWENPDEFKQYRSSRLTELEDGFQAPKDRKTLIKISLRALTGAFIIGASAYLFKFRKSIIKILSNPSLGKKVIEAQINALGSYFHNKISK